MRKTDSEFNGKNASSINQSYISDRERSHKLMPRKDYPRIGSVI